LEPTPSSLLQQSQDATVPMRRPVGGIPPVSGGEVAMPHNMFFGVSNYVSLGVVIVVVIVVVGFWWLRTGHR
jgi:hypothetical protein